MRLAGTRSWEFRADIGQSTHAALYVRDSLRLEHSGSGVPPGLMGDVPDRSELLDDAERAAVSREWLQAWHGMADHPPVVPTVRADDARIRALYDEAHLWFQPVRRNVIRENPQLIAWAVIRDAVKDVASARGVHTGSLRGTAEVLLVRGVWWRVLSPGFVLASVGAVSDPAAAGGLVRACLESGLDGTAP